MATSKKSASCVTEIPDQLLVEIFLRLPAPADLARAAAACVSFRRLFTDRSSLRSFRRLHAPLFLGFHDHDGFNPALPPHPFATAAGALALAADFSFSFLPSRYRLTEQASRAFLPSHCGWDVEDIRDGRVLLHRFPERHDQLLAFGEIAVCDPLHRRYVLLPPVPHDLAASVEHQSPGAAAMPMVRRPPCKSFLVPIGEEAATPAAAEETAFKVISIVLYKIKVYAFVFSSSTGQWRAAASKAWSDLSIIGREFDRMMSLTAHPFFFRRHYAYGCFYWDNMIVKMKRLLVLDTRRMEFSMADLPPGEWSRLGLAIVEAGEGRLGMFAFHVGGTASDLSYTIAQNNEGEGGPSQWQTEKTISLDSGYRYFIKDATERYLLLARTEASSAENPLMEYFSIDIKTLKLQSVCAKQVTRMRHIYEARIYTNFPPLLLSSPTI